VNSVGEAFGLAFRDPAWVGKVIVQALITIIPIVGWIATVGWLMMVFENARNGRNELPEAGFHLGRGIALFGAYVIYSIVLSIPGDILNGIGGGFNYHCTNNSNFCSNMYVGGPLAGLGSLWGLLAQLFLYFLTPTLVVMVFHSGFGGAFDLGRVWNYATTNVQNSVIGGLIVLVAGIIGSLGFVVCCIGFFFTVVYAATVVAGVAAWFERVQSAPAAPAAPLPPAPAS
jgi:hypothetical protein